MKPVARLQKIMSALDLEPVKGATDDELQAFEKKSGLALIPEVRDIYKASNGVALNKGTLSINTLVEALKYPTSAFFTRVLGLFPLVDNCDSDPWCVSCSGPLQGFVIQVCHDDYPPMKLKFRNLGSFLDALAGWIDDDQWDLHDMPCEFDAPKRSAADINLGRKVLQLVAGMEDEDERSHTAGLGVVLLSEGEVDDIAALLADKDNYVREYARWRLHNLQTPKARAALQTEHANKRAFIKKSLVALTEAGIKATLHESGDTIQIDPGEINLDMNAFLHQDPAAIDHVVERAKFFLAEQKKRK